MKVNFWVLEYRGNQVSLPTLQVPPMIMLALETQFVSNGNLEHPYDHTSPWEWILSIEIWNTLPTCDDDYYYYYFVCVYGRGGEGVPNLCHLVVSSSQLFLHMEVFRKPHFYGPCAVSLLDWIPTFKWNMIKLVVKKGQFKDTRYNGIILYA